MAGGSLAERQDAHQRAVSSHEYPVGGMEMSEFPRSCLPDKEQGPERRGAGPIRDHECDKPSFSVAIDAEVSWFEIQIRRTGSPKWDLLEHRAKSGQHSCTAIDSRVVTGVERARVR
jgi:hypothetical protein